MVYASGPSRSGPGKGKGKGTVVTAGGTKQAIMQAVMRVEALLVAHEQRQLVAAGGGAAGASAGAGTGVSFDAGASDLDGGDTESEGSTEHESEEDRDMARFWATTSMTEAKGSVAKEGFTSENVINESVAKDSVAKESIPAAKEKKNGGIGGDIASRMDKRDKRVESNVPPTHQKSDESMNVVRVREEGEEGLYIRYFQAQALQSSSYMYNDWEVIHGRIKQYMALLSWYYEQHYSKYSDVKKKEKALSGFMSGA